MDKRYRLYVEMQQRGKGTGVYRLVAAYTSAAAANAYVRGRRQYRRWQRTV